MKKTRKIIVCLLIMLLILSSASCKKKGNGDNNSSSNSTSLTSSTLTSSTESSYDDENIEKFVALSIVYGNHANGVEINDAFLKEALLFDEKNLIVFSANVIVCDGSPSTVQTWDFQGIYDVELDKVENANMKNKDTILSYIKSNLPKANDGENDTLEAIRQAQNNLSLGEITSFIDKCKEDKELVEKRIVIIDNGIVTTGSLNFNAKENTFKDVVGKTDTSIEDIKESVSELNKKIFPDLSDIVVNFRVQYIDKICGSQKITPEKTENLRNFWEIILKDSCKAKFADVKLSNGDVKKLYSEDDPQGYPLVSPATTLFPDPPKPDCKCGMCADDCAKTCDKSNCTTCKAIPPPPTLPPVSPSDYINFETDKSNVLNEAEANKALKDIFAPYIHEYFATIPDGKIYIVGTISWHSDRLTGEIIESNTEGGIALSQQRATKVKEMLLNCDSTLVQYSDRLITVANGILNPWYKNYNTGVNPQENRKVLLFIDYDFGEDKFNEKSAFVKNHVF
ncbi:hypothetical protein FACS1894132_05930 [Clostridia bacterium]|nr:hypothetical protein FACS1894132_05930 [Clostridia bacterium]